MTTAIYEDFATKLAAFAQLQFEPYPISFPDVAFTPPASGFWLEAMWFNNKTRNYGLSNAGPSMRYGFAQVSVCCHPGNGITAPMQIAEAVIAYFAKGTRFDTALVYEKPWVMSPIQENARVTLPVTIPWQSGDS